MDLGDAALGLTFAGSQPASWLLNRDDIKITIWGDGTYYAGVRLDSAECGRLLDLMEHEHIVPLKTIYNIYAKADWWKNPDDCWVGALVSPDGFVRVSPANEFNPVFPAPCFGLVPSESPLHILSRPQTVIANAKFELIYSKEASSFLASLAPCQVGALWLDDHVVQSHHRVFPQHSRPLLANDLMCRVPCTACGTPIRRTPGTMLGRRMDEFAVCRNEQGVGHLDSEHPVILSVAAAGQLKRHFPTGFGLEPILDVDSPLGQRIAYLIQRLGAIRK